MGAGDELDREIDEHYREKVREPGPGPDPGAAGAPAELRTRDGRTQEELDREMDEYFKKEPLEPGPSLISPASIKRERVTGQQQQQLFPLVQVSCDWSSPTQY